jgi:hypothetical protein
MSRIACSHPGRLGDALYALPTIRKLSQILETPIDFYTSEYCEPLRRLFEYQSSINEFIVPDDYVIERHDCGIQPWRMPIPNVYDRVYHLGFRGVPTESLDFFIAHSVGLDKPAPIQYEHPNMGTLAHDYIVLAARGETTFKQLFKAVIHLCPIDVVEIGGSNEAIGGELTLDMTGVDFLDTLDLIAGAKGYVGLISSQLALANGFPIPKVAPHDGRSWDMRHVVYGRHNYYPILPDAQKVLEILGL